jgi:hypothetical protein
MGGTAIRAEVRELLESPNYSHVATARADVPSEPEELFSMTTTPEMIERNSGRFGVLTGVLSVFPFDQRGPNLDFMVARSHDIGRWT